eukprot:334115-Chlamydomonas_euryale.AAC.5
MAHACRNPFPSREHASVDCGALTRAPAVIRRETGRLLGRASCRCVRPLHCHASSAACRGGAGAGRARRERRAKHRSGRVCERKGVLRGGNAHPACRDCGTVRSRRRP